MTLTHTVDTALLDFFTKRAGPEAIVDPELAKVVVGLIEGSEAQPIETAPWGKWVMLWWTPVNDNPSAERWIIGQVAAPEDIYAPDPKPTKYWDGGHAGPKVDADGCKDLDRITHWRPLPAPPAKAIRGKA